MGGKLTPKQEAWIECRAIGMNQSDAYREAYDAEGMTPKQIWEEASKLASSPKVSQRLFELQEEARERTLVSVASITEELDEARDLAKKLDQPAAMTGAVMGKAKVNGLLVDRVGDPNGKPIQMPTEIILRAVPAGNDNSTD